jgi:TolB-like protein/DNA-binding winged helix-turn-helix (wHTH) protein/Tfp pilus assembly protein PilF
MDESPAVPLRIGAWCVNPASGQISRAGQTVRVEARAMRLLLCLAEHAGEVVSIDELLDRGWPGVIVTPDSVYQAVTSLRRLLEDDARQPTYIATVPRLGYRMVATVGPWLDHGRLDQDRPDHAESDRAEIDRPVASKDGSPTSSSEPPATTATDDAPILRTRRRAGVPIAIGVAVILVLIVAYLFASRYAPDVFRSASVNAPQARQSIGVLPFLDLTEEMDQEYFADGMTEELIDMLSKIPGLRVPARTSSFYFKGRQTTIADIAKTLGVAYVLEGSVRKSGTTLRVTAQLIRADNGYHVWSETYDRPLNDILMVQDDIATEVRKALIASLEEAARPAIAVSSSPAYPAYFQARTLRRGDRTKEQAQAIVGYLHEAIRLDPAYAPAWAELARTLAYQSFNQLVPADSVDEEAHHAAKQALTLDPQLADAHLAQGIVHGYLDHDWAGAEHEYRNVLAVEPGSAEVYAFLSGVRRRVGNVDEAAGLMQQAVELDPLDGRYHQWLGEMNYSLGRFAIAEANFRKALDIDPEVPALASLGEVQLANGNPDVALETIERETDERSRTRGRALVYFALHRNAEADAELAKLETGNANDSAFGIARIHAYRNEVDQAFAWLDRAVAQHDPECIDIKNDPLLRTLRGDGRYPALLRTMKLPE